MNGLGSLDTKLNRKFNNEQSSADKPFRISDKLSWNKYSSKGISSKNKQWPSSDGRTETKSQTSELSKLGQVSSTNYDNSFGNRSENEQFDSVGETLSDGIKLMKMFPILNSYQEIDTTNRSCLWNAYLEGHGSKYDKLVVNNREIYTLINSNAELNSTKLDLENQSTISLDIDRTRNSIQNLKDVAEK